MGVRLSPVSKSSSFRSYSTLSLVIPLPDACDSQEAQPHSCAPIGRPCAAAVMADVPRNRETVSVSVDKHSPRPDLKETTQTTSASHPSAHQPSAPPQHLVSTAAEGVSLWLKVSWRLKRNFPVFYDTVAELLMLRVIMSLRQTALINTNVRAHVLINIYAGNQRLQTFSQADFESVKLCRGYMASIPGFIHTG